MTFGAIGQVQIDALAADRDRRDGTGTMQNPAHAAAAVGGVR